MSKFKHRENVYLDQNIESGDGILLYGLEGDQVTIQEVEPNPRPNQTYIVYVHSGRRNIRVNENQLRKEMYV